MQSLRSFNRRLRGLCFLRAAINGATVWLFLWGVAVLVMRIAWQAKLNWLPMGLLTVIPVGLAAGWRACRQMPDFKAIRANFDRLNSCGGLIMSEEAADMSAWRSHLPPCPPPRVRWRARKELSVLCVSAGFVATALLLPDQIAHFSAGRRLEIGQLADQLRAEVQVLHHEKIIPDNKADELRKQLRQVETEASGNDPEKTWEALDHIKQSNSADAHQAVEEAIAKTESLSQAQTLAEAMQEADDNGMTNADAAQAAQDLSKMLASAKLEDGLLDVKLPAGSVASLKGLNKEQLKKLLSAMHLSKESLKGMAESLADLKMIDPDKLAECLAADQTGDAKGLADLLAASKDGYDPGALAALLPRGKGGPGGGGPASPMTWSDPKSEKDVKFQSHTLPPAASLADAKLIGVSRSSPQLSGNAVDVGHGALDNAQGSGGSAHAQVILPEQRQAVRDYFQRNGK